MAIRLGQPQNDAQIVLGLDRRRTLSAKFTIFKADHATVAGRSYNRVSQRNQAIPANSLGRRR